MRAWGVRRGPEIRVLMVLARIRGNVGEASLIAHLHSITNLGIFLSLIISVSEPRAMYHQMHHVNQIETEPRAKLIDSLKRPIKNKPRAKQID